MQINVKAFLLLRMTFNSFIEKNYITNILFSSVISFPHILLRITAYMIYVNNYFLFAIQAFYE